MCTSKDNNALGSTLCRSTTPPTIPLLQSFSLKSPSIFSGPFVPRTLAQQSRLSFTVVDLVALSDVTPDPVPVLAERTCLSLKGRVRPPQGALLSPLRALAPHSFGRYWSYHRTQCFHSSGAFSPAIGIYNSSSRNIWTHQPSACRLPACTVLRPRQNVTRRWDTLSFRTLFKFTIPAWSRMALVIKQKQSSPGSGPGQR